MKTVAQKSIVPDSNALELRDSEDGDLAAITAIYRYAVLNDTGTFEEEPPSDVEMAQRRAEVLAEGLPYLVAEMDGKVVGFCYAHKYQPRSAYRFTIEDSIYIDLQYRNRGVGTRLLQVLIERCEELGRYHSIVAIIGDSKNEGSTGVHKNCGFKNAGVLTEVGFKFDKWIDTVHMERPLENRSNISIPNLTRS